MACSCHLPFWEAGGIVNSDEQCKSIHLQPVSHRSEYPVLFDAGLYSSPLVLGLSSSCVTVCLQEDNIPWFQHYSTGTVIIISFLLTCFEYILPVCFIEHFREMLLECSDEIINTHHMPFSYCREMEVYGEPQTVPKQKIMRAVAHYSRHHSIVSLN